MRRFVRVCSWLYSIAIAAYWLTIELGGDRSWFATLLLFGPRWIVAVPLFGLLAAAAVWRRRSLWLLSMAGVFVVFCPLDFRLSVSGVRATWSGFSASQRRARHWADRHTLRVLTANVDLAKGGRPKLDDLVNAMQPDVVALQECEASLDPHFLNATDWQSRREHNLWLASRWPIVRHEKVYDDGQLGYWGTIALLCELETPGGRIAVVNVHLETPREGIDAVLTDGLSGWIALQDDIRRRAKISALARKLAETSLPTIVLGDFNMPVESAIYRRDWGGFQNAFSARGLGFGNTKFTRWFGVRIDHVLADTKWSVADSVVAGDIGSDHRPLLADLTLGE